MAEYEFIIQYLVYFVYAFLGLMTYTIFKTIKKAVNTRKCFDDEVLDDYFHGRLKREEDLKRAVVAHLGVCEKCQEKMHRLQSNK